MITIPNYDDNFWILYYKIYFNIDLFLDDFDTRNWLHKHLDITENHPNRHTIALFIFQNLLLVSIINT